MGVVHTKRDVGKGAREEGYPALVILHLNYAKKTRGARGSVSIGSWLAVSQANLVLCKP